MIDYKSSNLKPEIIEAIAALGFETPTPIQAECIPFILETTTDLIANAQTGTGKTAAFGLPILQQVDVENNSVQAIILSPTRELAIQISKDMQNYSSKMRGVKITTVYGGASIEPQITALKRGTHIVVGTPGRVLDLVKRKILKLQNVKWLVLDEADEMLNMGFKDDLDDILETTPETRQTLLFSATLPKGILQISKNYMTDPKQIAVAKANLGADDVEHHYYQVNARDKYAALKRIADINPNIYAITFCRTRRETKDIADKLMRDGYNADSLHGDLSQAQREHVMNRFRLRSVQILVATDVAARGLDVSELTHVINYSLPDDPEVYVHRSGRTGRAGNKGISATIIHNRENRKLREIENLLGKKFIKTLVPNGREICEKQLFKVVGNMENLDLSNSEIDSFMDVIYSKLENMSKEEVIKRFVAVEFNRFLDYYKNAPDLNSNDSRGNDSRDGRRDKRRGREDRDGRGDRRERAPRKDRGNSNMQRCYINIGSKNSVNPAAIIGLINKATPGKSVDIGQIEILKKFSFFEVDPKFSKDVIEGISGMDYRGEEVLAEHAESAKPSSTSKPKSSSRPYSGGNSRGDSRGGSSSRRSSGSGYGTPRKNKDSSKQRRAKKQW